jgi:hypothetical protein
LKNVASIFLLKNVVTFVGKMLLQHFLKNVDENVGNNPENVGTFMKNVGRSLQKNVGRSLQKMLTKKCGNTSEKC